MVRKCQINGKTLNLMFLALTLTRFFSPTTLKIMVSAVPAYCVTIVLPFLVCINIGSFGYHLL